MTNNNASGAQLAYVRSLATQRDWIATVDNRDFLVIHAVVVEQETCTSQEASRAIDAIKRSARIWRSARD